MAKTIPQLTDATTVNAADELIISQGGITKRATASELLNSSAIVTATGSTDARSLAARFADVVNVKDFGAVGDGVADDTAAIQAAVNTNKVVVFPEGTYKTDTAVTGIGRMVTTGAVFTGANPIDTYPAFGTGSLKVFSKGNNNSFIGIAHNTLSASTLSFPTGVTGYGRNDNAGNAVFGIYAEARQYANTGCVTNEIDSFNHGAAPSSNLPPDRSIGTTQQHPIALTVAAGGTANSSIGIEIGREGSSPQKFLTGIYLQADGVVDYGLFIDATSASTSEAIVAKHVTSRICINAIGQGTPVSANAWISYADKDGNPIFGIKQSGRCSFNTGVTQSTRGVAGAAQVLPSNPNGYLQVEIGGIMNLIPYYAP
jgi:hypothetical protein